MRIISFLLICFPFLLDAESQNDLRDRLQKNAKRPPWPNGVIKPLDVKIGVYIESLGKFQSTEMSFDIDLYLYMSWKDYTLNHSNPDYVLINDPKVREHIWLPDLYFANARTATFHDVTVPNFNLFIAQDGTIAYSSRVTLTVACNLQLSMYPIDHQICQVRILSYAYIANQINVTWFKLSPIRYNPEIGLPEFVIQQIKSGYCDGTYMYAIMENSHKIDRFSCLEANIHLRRSVGYHLVQSYIPTALIVVISWVSFWIDRRATPARVTLSFTTLLSLSTLGNGLRFGLPMVSYVKAIDYWYGICMVFVFLALLEFALVNSYMRQANKYEKLSRALEKRQMSVESDPENSGPYIPNNKKYSSLLLGNKKSNDLSPQKSNVPLSTFPKRRIILSRSLSSLKGNNVENHEYYTCSNYNSSTQNGFACDDKFVPLAAMDLDDSMTLPPESIVENGQIPSKPVVFTRTTDESPTKTTFISDEEWPEQVPVLQTTNSRSRGKKVRHRERHNLGVNHFIQLGFINSRKALKIDKMSRILFPVNFTIFCTLYWFYYLIYVPWKYER